jgi:hypothetical protein
VAAQKISVYASGVTLKYQSEAAGPAITSYAAIPPRPTLESFSHDRSEPKRTPRLNPGRSPDRNGDDDGTGATAATDIRPRDGSSDIDHRRSNKACIVGIRGQCKRESHRLLWTRWVPR